jgi:hypothetical protein
MKRIALIYMHDGEEFFFEDPPDSDVENWIQNVVNDPSEVEFVDIYTVGDMVQRYRNPNMVFSL